MYNEFTRTDQITPRKKRGRKEKDNAARDAAIHQLIQDDPSCTSIDIVDLLRARPVAIICSASVVLKTLHKIGWSNKTIVQLLEGRNSQSTLQRRRFLKLFNKYRDWALTVTPWPDNEMWFLDECGFDLRGARALRGWSPVGIKCFMDVPNNQGRRVNVIFAISTTGVMAYQIL